MAKQKDSDNERKKILDEKVKVKKEQEARLKKRLKNERKKIDKIITFPYNFLFYLGTIGGTLSFLWFFFAQNHNFLFSLLKGFLIMSIVYLGGGLIFFLWVVVVARIRQREMEEKRRQEEEAQREREKAELEGKLERELLLKQAAEKREQELKKLKEQLSTTEQQKQSTNFEDIDTINFNQ
ncbi:MAG: hypothetical protein ACUVQ1_04290 [Candidatus Kapaibacteriales bacterium]